MCYVAIYSKEKTPKIAKEDILVIKRLWKTNSEYFSEYQMFPYPTEEFPDKVELVPEIEGWGDDCYWNIYKGYHSWTKDSIHIKYDFNYNYKSYKSSANKTNLYYCLFMIPKGTKYYQNEDGEIVSETIAFIGEI